MITPLLSLALGLPLVLPQAEETSWVVRAEWVHTAAGDAIEGGHVAVEDGKIASVGKGKGRGGDVLECFAVTPGLVDLSVRIDTGSHSIEQSSEMPVELSVADALDLFSHRWLREAKSGVTTVLANPNDEAVLGGMGVVLKTAGPPTLGGRMLKADAVLRASMGSQPSSGNFAPRGRAPSTFYARRPTTRMGVEWVFRKAFYDALAAQRSGVGELEARAAERLAVLGKALSGEIPVGVQAWATQDIRTAVYLKEEFDIPNMYVDAAAEAWREPELLVRSGMGVVLPPHSFAGRVTDSAFFAWNTAAMLHEKGVPLALSGHGSRAHGARLARQAGYAMRGGLPFEAALDAVTLQPARMAGVADRVGSLEGGKDADLVLWSGPPFELSSQIIGVLVDGRLIVDPRPAEEDE